MRFYTNVQQYGNNILFIGYNNGKKIKKSIPYKPNLFVQPGRNNFENENSLALLNEIHNDHSSSNQSSISSSRDEGFRTIDNSYVKRIQFDSISDAKDFIKSYKEIENFPIYGMTKFVYPFLNDAFPNGVEYDSSLIKVVFLDIESKLPKGDFENYLSEASEQITAITIRLKKEILTFGLKDYIPQPGAKYIKCRDEYELLSRFIEIWNTEHWSPDVVTGWNIEFYDIPYLINRIRKILGNDQANRMSPWGKLYDKKIFVRGKEQSSYVPLGISILDYYALYRKFTYNQLESYSLKHVAHVELGRTKVDYSEYENLDELYEKDPQKYYFYNAEDTNLVYELDEKHQLIELIFRMSYDAKINYNDSLGTVLPWEVIIHNYLMAKKVVMPSQKKKHFHATYEGAYVKDPILGMHNWGVSFDLTSLYPHLIIQYNISPETYMHKLPGVTVTGILNDQVPTGLKGSLAANGCVFSNEKSGFLPDLMALFFTKRKEYKNKMLEYKKLKEQGHDVDNEIVKYKNAQMAMKIFLNSAYGAIGNPYFIFYNPDIAEAITTSGQLSIRWAEKGVNKYLQEKLSKYFEKAATKDFVIASDTDSMYLDLDYIARTCKSNDPNKIADHLDHFSETIIQPEIDRLYSELEKITNAFTNAMFMKRECIFNKAIWKAKKMYILNMIDEEGVRYAEPKLKMMGIEAIRSTTPEVCRNALKDSFKIIMNKDNAALIEYISDFEKTFKSLPFADIASAGSVKGISKYKENGEMLYKKGTPFHTKGAIIYNHLLKQHKINMEPIYDGDKIKYAYLKNPNPAKSEVIATPGYLPKQFKLNDFIDVNQQYEKTYLSPLRSITDVIGWKTEESYTLEDFM